MPSSLPSAERPWSPCLGRASRARRPSLAGTYMVRRLTPWFENIGKRQVKTPKIYFRDTGIYHRVMNMPDRAILVNHPKLGPLWEGLALEELIRASGASDEEVFFWGVHGQEIGRAHV